MATPVIILNWNGWDDTFACLRSLRDGGERGLVWLVDNASTIDRCDEARLLYPELRTLRWDQNYGYAGGYNRALKLAAKEGHEFAYLLNNDCVVTPGFLTPTVVAAETDSGLGVVGSRIAYADQPGFLEFDGEYHAAGDRPFYQDTGIKIVNHVIGAGMLVRLEALERHGYFDERFFCYGEEVELCSRMNGFNYLSAVCADSLILHRSKGSDINANAWYYQVRNRFLSLQRLSGVQRKEQKQQTLYKATVAAEEARRARNFQGWLAIACAVYDGLHGRFGKRPDKSALLLPCIFLVSLSLYSRLSDKWRFYRGKRIVIDEGKRLN
ncbi:MAG: glycosyltransferase family 2 protein [Blastocatellales bacterium]